MLFPKSVVGKQAPEDKYTKKAIYLLAEGTKIALERYRKLTVNEFYEIYYFLDSPDCWRNINFFNNMKDEINESLQEIRKEYEEKSTELLNKYDFESFRLLLAIRDIAEILYRVVTLLYFVGWLSYD